METEGAPVDDAVVELLGYDPENFLDDVINAANTLIYNALTSLQKFVEKEMNGPNSETEQGMVKMETLMEQAVDTWFLKFETECRAKIFKAPDSLKPLLPQYRVKYRRFTVKIRETRRKPINFTNTVSNFTRLI